MVRTTSFTRCIICVVLLASTTACSTTRQVTVSDSNSLTSQIEVGDKVEVLRNDGSQLTFKVTEVSPEGLRGPNEFVPMTDIGQLHVSERIQPGVVVLIVVLAAVAAYVIVEGEPEHCGDYWWQEPCLYE